MITESPTKCTLAKLSAKYGRPKRERLNIELNAKLRAKLAKLGKRNRTTPAQTLRDLIAAAK